MFVGGTGGEAFLADPHGTISCITCHGGVEGTLTKSAAHEGITAKPSTDYEAACGQCHGDITAVYETSLHQNFHGYKTFFETRSGMSFEDHPEIEEEFDNECGKCHTTCGECHISRPRSVAGGLSDGHRFRKTPSQSDQCTACHGSRVGEEYTGSRDGYSSDVHYIPYGMNCVSCHTGEEMHGDGTVYETRYQENDMPRCEFCHTSAAEANIYHSTHWDNFQCNVCHSQDYKSCNLCHVGGTGIREPSYINFKIGKNPISEERDYEYVVLRHIPIAEDTYSPWGVNELSNYSDLPTWKYASPHNIKRWTARTDTTGGLSCGTSCHTSEEYFLRAADLEDMSEAERAANLPYIVPDGPPTGWDE